MSEQKFKVAMVGDLKEGQKKRVMAGQQAIMLALIEGQYFAVQDNCSHRGASLTAGELNNYRIECAWHGAQFDIRTGEVKALPAAIPLKTFKVMVENGEIWVLLDVKP